MKFQYIFLLIIVFLTYVQAKSCPIRKFITNLANLFSSITFHIIKSSCYFFIQKLLAASGLVQPEAILVVMDQTAPELTKSLHLLDAVTNFSTILAARVKSLVMCIVVIANFLQFRLNQSQFGDNFLVHIYIVFSLVIHI